MSLRATLHALSHRLEPPRLPPTTGLRLAHMDQGFVNAYVKYEVMWETTRIATLSAPEEIRSQAYNDALAKWSDPNGPTAQLTKYNGGSDWANVINKLEKCLEQYKSAADFKTELEWCDLHYSCSRG